MIVSEALKGVRTICDTAPLIYYVEQHPTYFELTKTIFERANQGELDIITSTLTLAEVLTKPIQAKNTYLQREYRDLLLNTAHVTTIDLDAVIASQAAQVRAQYNLRMPDAIQVATGLHMSCDAFLTNDKGLKRVTQMAILLLDDIEMKTDS
jgi:predicted nucleic acid-binding protein